MDRTFMDRVMSGSIAVPCIGGPMHGALVTANREVVRCPFFPNEWQKMLIGRDRPADKVEQEMYLEEQYILEFIEVPYGALHMNGAIYRWNRIEKESGTKYALSMLIAASMESGS